MCLNSIYLSDQWVLDSGATDHMTGNKTLLHNFVSSTTTQYVTVANGDKMEILGFGSIKIFSKIISQVLLVKNCASNLLSVSKLTHELKCKLIFSSTNIFFQDLITKTVIGDGFLENGLYFLNKEKINLVTRCLPLKNLKDKVTG
jgi:hypothetical protein